MMTLGYVPGHEGRRLWSIPLKPERAHICRWLDTEVTDTGIWSVTKQLRISQTLRGLLLSCGLIVSVGAGNAGSVGSVLDHGY